VDLLRDQGIRAGALRVRMFRPFPADPLRKLLAGARHIAVIDRNLSPGLGGVLWSELKTFYDGDAVVQDYMMGLGGGDVRPEHLVQVVEDVTRRDQASTPQILEVA
jgi:pyruvate/2-oxoacid:ferredoxin oxidoreductase alpha subunit